MPMTTFVWLIYPWNQFDDSLYMVSPRNWASLYTCGFDSGMPWWCPELDAQKTHFLSQTGTKDTPGD